MNYFINRIPPINQRLLLHVTPHTPKLSFRSGLTYYWTHRTPISAASSQQQTPKLYSQPSPVIELILNGFTWVIMQVTEKENCCSTLYLSPTILCPTALWCYTVMWVGVFFSFFLPKTSLLETRFLLSFLPLLPSRSSNHNHSKYSVQTVWKLFMQQDECLPLQQG